MPRPDSFSSLTSTRRSWFGYGMGRSKTASSTLKIAAEAPMPSARVRIAISVKAGDLTRVRKAYFKSFITKRDDGIDFHGAARGEKTRQQSSQEQNKNRGREEKRVIGGSLIELRRDQATKTKNCDQSSHRSENDRPHSLIDDEPQDVARLRAQRHANADFRRALGHAVGDRPVNSDAGEEKRHAGEDGQ